MEECLYEEMARLMWNATAATNASWVTAPGDVKEKLRVTARQLVSRMGFDNQETSLSDVALFVSVRKPEVIEGVVAAVGKLRMYALTTVVLNPAFFAAPQEYLDALTEAARRLETTKVR